jgi:hypothetical protein
MEGRMKKIVFLSFVVLFLGLTSTSLFAQYDNSPATYKVVPSVIWAPASGGGTWYTELQIYTEDTSTEVDVYFDYGGGSYRYHFILWESDNNYDLYKSTNILATLAARDPSFTYYGRSGALRLYSYGGEIQVMARTYHSGNYAKTICGLSNTDSNTCSDSRHLMIMNAMNSSSFRTSVTLFNIGSACTVYIQIIQNGSVIGSFNKSMVANSDYMAFNVFTEAGMAGTYTNCFVLVWTSTGGRVFCSGATAHNSTNDPAYHVAQGWNF